MGIASVSKIMFVDKIIATSSGIWQIQVLIAVSQVNLSLGQKSENILCSFDLGSQRWLWWEDQELTKETSLLEENQFATITMTQQTLL